jgi:hypothetical protein
VLLTKEGELPWENETKKQPNPERVAPARIKIQREAAKVKTLSGLLLSNIAFVTQILILLRC